MSDGEGSGPSLLALAAGGDRDALALFRDELVAEANGGASQFRHSDLIAQAEVFARLTAAHGHPADKAYLASFALLRARQARDDGNEQLANFLESDGYQLADEVLALNDALLTSTLAFSISQLADHGDETAAIALGLLIRNLTPEAAAAITARVHSLDEKVEA